MLTYAEKRRKPSWQKKRLHILNRDEFTCQCCGDKETELHIHHKYYITGAEPWEYEDDALITLCKHCHYLTELLKKENLTVIEACRKCNDDSILFILLVTYGDIDKASHATISYIYRHASNDYNSFDGVTYKMFLSIKSLFEKHNIQS